jgi:AcrR family transcriptional regulator
VSDVKRPYSGTWRQAQAAATRREVLDAAGELFSRRGYAATSIDAIAAQAGVSRETIFKSFGSKRRLLQLWVERQVAGPDEPVPVEQQHWLELVRDANDRRRQIEIAVAAVSAIFDRAIDAISALRAAAHADPEIAELWRLACEQRRHDVSTVTALLSSRSPAAPDLTDDEVVDVVYALTSPELFELLVRQCGWAPERFRHWLVAALLALAFDGDRPSRE